MYKTQKPLFIVLSAVSIASLVTSFGFSLTQMEVWRQTEKGNFDTTLTKTFIISSSSSDYPYGFNKARAKKVGHIYHPKTLEKILLLTTSLGCSVVALIIGKELVLAVEYEQEISKLTLEGKKELSLKAIKQRFALANKSQQLLFLDEMKVLMQEFSSPEEEILDCDELSALYDQVEENQLGKDEAEETKPEATEFRSTYPEQLDQPSWRAIQKAIADGATREEIIKEVLGGGTHAESYFDYLKSKYL